MNPPDDEQELRRRFEAWREQEHGSAPPFQFIWARAKRAAPSPRRSSTRAAVRFALGGAALALVVVWFAAQGPPPPGSNRAANTDDWSAQLAALESDLAEPGPSEWAAPTDYLLASISDHYPSTLTPP